MKIPDTVEKMLRESKYHTIFFSSLSIIPIFFYSSVFCEFRDVGLSRLVPGISDSNPARGMDVCLCL
jgi:hypothetical protein